MWDTYRLSAVGNFSLRKIALLIVAALMSALFVAIAHTTTTFADGATWEGDSIKYGGKTYTKMTNPPSALPGFSPSNSQYYQAADGDNVSIIAIKPNPDKSKDITDAQVGTFKKDAGNNYSSAGPPSAVSIAAAAAATEGEATAEDGVAKTSCNIEGVGWIICGPSRWIANGMDMIYGWISDFLTVKPLSTDTNNGMYQAWEIVRGLANACFILAFLVIIYSQITSFGISNYEIKKMIPKLIIAAILVNVSYFICGIAIDLSNVLGDSVQDALIQIREALRTAPSTGQGWDWNAFSFKNITEYLLSGGTIGAAAFAGWTAFTGATVGGTISGLIFMLFPILVAGILSVTVALIILAARQALITVLVVLAPLAFVAFLLPNTEKWFSKWRELFTTMMLVFPMFSLLFGGSQLASYLILQNADQLTIILLALFIQVAPLALTPFLIQFSGSLLGRFAGMVNNPQKGLIDRTSNWAKDRAEVRAARARERVAKGGGTFAQRSAFKRETGKLNREAWKKRGESYLNAAWANDERYADHHDALGEAELRQKSGEASANTHFERRRARDKGLQRYVANQRINEDIVKNLQAKEEAEWEEAKAADMGANNRFRDKHTAAMREAQQAQVTAYRTGTAQAMQRIDYAKAITGGATAEAQAIAAALAKEAGGIDSGGADSARATALAALNKGKLESIAEGRRLSQYYNLTSKQRQQLASGITVTGKADDGSTREFNMRDSEYVFLSAVEDQVTNGTVKEKLELIMKTGEGQVLHKHREVVTDAMLKGGLPQQAAFMSGQIIDEVRNGKFGSYNDLMRASAIAIAKGKLSAETLVNQDKTSMETIVKAIRELDSGHVHLEGDQLAAVSTELDRLFASAETAMQDPRISVRLGERTNAMTDLVNIGRLGTNFTNPTGGAPLPTPDDNPPQPPAPDEDIDSGL